MRKLRVGSVFAAGSLMAAALFWQTPPAAGLEKPDTTYKVFQFPADKIPRIDGKADDWAMVPDDYAIGMDQMKNDGSPNAKPDPKSLDVKVKVGWVKDLNRLYFLYEAYDDYWDFSQPDMHNDTFEVIVDADRSGGPLTADRRLDKAQDVTEAFFSMQGAHAQNYHIFTPAQGKDWCMAWGPQAPWIKKLPYSNIAYNYNFKPGEAGKLTMEFWITPFDYAGADGPPRAVESVLKEDKIIGLCWAIMDYDDATKPAHAFWNLSPKHTMFAEASELVGFKLMPLEKQFKKEIDAKWSFKIVDMDRRLVAFKDESEGKVTSWKWDFGDGGTSTEQNPIHAYEKAGQRYVVVLDVEGPAGKARWSRVWDIALK